MSVECDNAISKLDCFVYGGATRLKQHGQSAGGELKRRPGRTSGQTSIHSTVPPQSTLLQLSSTE